MPRYIDEKNLYDDTGQGKDIFAYYFPDYDFGSSRAFVKERAQEKTASSRIVMYQGLWRITDFGNQQEVNGMPGIAYVMHREKLLYYEALLFVESVILKRVITSTGFVKPKWSAKYSFREMEPADKKGDYSFVYKEKASDCDLAAIGPFVKQEHLDKFNCKVVLSYEYCYYAKKLNRDVVHIFESTDDYPIFVFDYGDFKKIYKPHDMEKKNRFSYVGIKPKDYIYGWKQLLGEANEFVDTETNQEFAPSDNPSARVKDLYRCSGESDALNMHSIGCHVYWLNSESADYGSNFKIIDDFCENHYQILDLDATGQIMARKIALRYINILTLTLPEWLSDKKDFRGNSCKDIKDFIAQHDNPDDAAAALRVRKNKARKVKFWSKSKDKDTYNIDMTYFYYFLHVNGFSVFDYPYLKGFDFCYAKENEKIVNIISPDKAKRIVKSFTEYFIESKNLSDERYILNKLYGSNQISEGNLDMLKERNYNFTNCNENVEYIHFNNCSLRITPTSIDKVSHREIPNHILGSYPISKSGKISHIIDFNLLSPPSSPAIEVDYSEEYDTLLNSEPEEVMKVRINNFPEQDKYNIKINDTKFIFTSFLRNATRIHWRKDLESKIPLTPKEQKDEMLALANVMFCLGYMAAQYKNEGKPWVVFLMDMKVSDIGKSSGRSGKSLITKALKHIRNSFYIGGRELSNESKYQFLYDGYTEFHDIIEVDDLAEHANFDFFYTQITGNRTINCKNSTPFTLEYSRSGKMIFSTNFEIPRTDNSTMSRLLQCGISDYYHESTAYDDYVETRSPLGEFGRQLYNDFTNEEWNSFYYFMAYCIQLQMRIEKIVPPSENLKLRQLRKVMSSGLGQSENFLYWADDYFQQWDGDDARPKETGVTLNVNESIIYLDTLFCREDVQKDFLENSGLSQQYKNKFSSQSFRARLQAWCEYRGYELNPDSVITDIRNRRIIKKISGKTKECFYIRTIDTDNDDYNTDKDLPF